MSMHKGDLKVALSAMRSTRWRSLLTMSGVIIGICSVVTIVSIGEGIKHQITGQINQLGKDLIMVRPGSISTKSTTEALNTFTIFSGVNDYTPLTLADEQIVATTPKVAEATPLSLVPGSVRADGHTFNNTLVVGSSSSAADVLKQPLQYGDFFPAEEQGTNVAVLGPAVANELFPGEVPLGHSFSFHGQQFIVRGEFNTFDSAPFSLDADFNNVIFIPYSVAQQLEKNDAPIYEILARPTDPTLTASAVTAIKARLLAAHQGIQNFSVLKQDESLAASNGILNLLTSLISSIAAVSLLVGGIGIMNIMLVAVTERTHEIGIRKALGATNRQILNQFLVEATMLSLIGGIIGIIVSLIINVGLRITTSLQPAVSWQVVLLAAGVSILVGIVFGVTPAFKASRKDPIDALRYYQ